MYGRHGETSIRAANFNNAMNEKKIMSLADALEVIAGVLREIASSPVPASPEAAAAGLPDSDEAQAIAAFRGKVVVTLDDVRYMTGWGRDRILALIQEGSIEALPGTGSAGCPYEFPSLSVWRYIHQRDKAVPQVNGVNMNVLPPSRKKKGAAA